MKFIMIAPQYPENFHEFTYALKRRGVKVFGIGTSPHSQVPKKLMNSMEDYYYVHDMEDYNQVYKAVAYMVFTHGKMDRLESFDEYWLTMDAKLRSDFNIPGLKDNEIPYMKYKSVMKQIFKEAGAKVARGRVFSDFDDAKKTVEECGGYPVIVKPNSGVGASNTYRITNHQGLVIFFHYDYIPEIEYIMEEFISGDIVTYDGLTDKFGNIQHSSTLEYDKTVIDIVENDEDMFFTEMKKVPADLEALGKKVVKAFDIRERFFHIEFFRIRETNEIYALELNCRPGGGRCMDMINFSHEVDVFDSYARLLTIGDGKLDLSGHYFTSYVSRRPNKNYIHDDQTVRHYLGPALMAVDSFQGTFADVMGNIGYTIRHENYEELLTLTEFILAKY